MSVAMLSVPLGNLGGSSFYLIIFQTQHASQYLLFSIIAVLNFVSTGINNMLITQKILKVRIMFNLKQ